MLTKGEQVDCARLDERSSNFAASPRVLTVLSFVLEKLVARNDQLLDILGRGKSSGQPTGCRLGKSLSGFLGVRPPVISIYKYLERIHKYSRCSPSCFVVGFVYIDRLVHRFPDSLVVSLNVHRLLIASITVASKILDDVHHNNAFYGRVGGVSNLELNRLELELLFLLDFRVGVSSQVFESYCLHLEREMLMNTDGQPIEKALLFSEEAAEEVIND
ncbi:hypothetical protein MLD38_015782 [Melastoma candidum]|uniref:Uncharacterized protein n=1 Tax=Melastoma candidum TaxID=119954 RepID=A0ACB9RH61_9MYRT|nr:hypothetical protein MLD38_015782 [Melastoma candidum]